MNVASTETRRLGPYQLVGTWRCGGNGSVCRARDAAGARLVVKRFPTRFPAPELRAYPERYARRSFAAQALLDHLRRIAWTFSRDGRNAHINAPLDVICRDRSIYKVTRFVENMQVEGTPVTIANARALLGPEAMRQLVRSLVGQLAFLEEHGFVHGDIKAGNVIISRGEGDQVAGCLIDYDSGFFVGEAPAPDDLVGTGEYEAPEVLRYRAAGAEQPELAAALTCASDVFSLGVLLWELLGSEPPYDERWLWPARRMLASGRPCAPLGLEAPYRNLVASMLAMDPARRPSAHELLHQI